MPDHHTPEAELSRTLPVLRMLLGIAVLAYAFLFTASPASAARVSNANSSVEQKLPNGKIVIAGYRAGKPDLPAVLILHGFLQTGEFSTVARMAEPLVAAGYSVLTPTLSLGISRRKSPLACEALHTHRLEDDVAEVRLWIDWLAKQGHKRIVLTGHSFGNLQLVAYIAQHPHSNVSKLIAVSLLDADEHLSPGERKALLANIQQQAAHGERLITRRLSYCQNYSAPPEAFLSYLTWSRATVLNAISASKVPTFIIMGSKDERMGADWPSQIKARGIPLQLIEGANHFFDAQFEFDLQDAIAGAAKSAMP